MKDVNHFVLVSTLFLIIILTAFHVNGQDYKIGTEAGYIPFEFKNDQNVIVGFDVDLINAISEEANFTFDLINTSWNDIFDKVASGELDAAIAAISITDDRKQIVNFSTSYITGRLAIIIRPEDVANIESKEDLDGRKVGVIDGRFAQTWISKNTQALIVPCSNIDEEFSRLASNEIDAIVDEGTVVSGYLKMNTDIDAVLVSGLIVEDKLGIAVNKNNAELLKNINNALNNLKSDGTYDDIYSNWFLHDLFKIS
jgi:polar amino acid transport system substrate-binding protein